MTEQNESHAVEKEPHLTRSPSERARPQRSSAGCLRGGAAPSAEKQPHLRNPTEVTQGKGNEDKEQKNGGSECWEDVSVVVALLAPCVGVEATFLKIIEHRRTA